MTHPHEAYEPPHACPVLTALAWCRLGLDAGRRERVRTVDPANPETWPDLTPLRRKRGIKRVATWKSGKRRKAG